MDTKFEPTFIPKKTLAVSSRPAKRFSVFTMISLVVLIVSIAGAAIVFLLESQFKNKIVMLERQLQEEEKNFHPAAVDDLEHIDLRLRTSESLLGSHVSTINIFDLLQRSTVRNVRFRDFRVSYTRGEKEEVVSVSASGEGRSFNAVAFQSDVLSSSKDFINPVLSGLSLDETGNVLFSFSASVKPSIVKYIVPMDVSESGELGIPTVETPQEPGIFNQ